MKKFYLTFRQDKLLAGYVVMIKAKDKKDAQALASKQFDENWERCYTQTAFKQQNLSGLTVIEGGVNMINETIFEIQQIVEKIKTDFKVDLHYHDKYDRFKPHAFNISTPKENTFRVFGFCTREEARTFIKAFAVGVGVGKQLNT
jgi:hypothetical protein